MFFLVYYTHDKRCLCNALARSHSKFFGFALRRDLRPFVIIRSRFSVEIRRIKDEQFVLTVPEFYMLPCRSVLPFLAIENECQSNVCRE